MAKGFGSELQTQGKTQEKPPQKRPLASLKEIQDSLFGYVNEIQDPRVQRTQKHLFKDKYLNKINYIVFAKIV